MKNTLSTQKQLAVGMKIYFEDENYQGNGTIHYIPSIEECKRNCFIEIHGENCISVKPLKSGRPRFIPLSQIILL